METSASPRGRGRVLSFVASTVLVFAACSGSGATSAPPAASNAPSGGGSAAATTAALPAPEQTTIRIGISAATEPVQFAEKLADTLGYYKDNGFTNVQITSLEGDGKVVQSLIAGALDFGVIGVSSAVASVPTDTPLTVVSMNGVKLTDGFFCTANIKTAADVKGQKVAISTFGGTSNGSVLLSLKALGLGPSDVTITQIGNEAARIAALKAGSVGCSVVDISEKDQMATLGFNLLSSELDSNIQWGRSGLAVTADFAQKNPNTVLDVVAAALKAQNYMFTNNQDAIQPFSDWSQQSVADATPQVTGFLQYGDQSMGWTDDAFTIPRDTLATVNPAVKDVDVTKAYDKSFLQQLWDMGYYQQINDPQQPFK
ncbi:MAG TPA: ABC transporter substrate-binding protein [Candidatus Limnocylindrales bacterium]|nr:ABC transporter substrate-binding protein [Candidatus Limnocylindrales bacterium]